MSKAAMNLQDSFLNQVRRENSEVRVLLVNGTLLRGVVKGFDNFTLILNNRNGQHLVYKHAIAQIVSHRPHVKPEDMSSHEAPEGAEGGEQTVEGSETTREQQGERAGGERPPRRENQRREHRAEHREGRDHREHRDNKNKQDQPRPKKEGFNTLDLSGVKLGEK